MATVNEIFSEYTSMRNRGLETSEVLNVLRPYISPLSKSNRMSLAQLMRNWEKQPAPAESRVETNTQINWIACNYCGKKNRQDAAFCYSCGLLLDVASTVGTKHFTDNLSLKNDYFGPESVLILKVYNTDHEFEVRLQTSRKEMSIGRSVPMSTMLPDVDLSEADAERQGVSRLHMAISYDAKTKAIQVRDLGSVNGTFINEQKLHPDEIRVLRNGDVIKLGRLTMRADFYHPGNEI